MTLDCQSMLYDVFMSLKCFLFVFSYECDMVQSINYIFIIVMYNLLKNIIDLMYNMKLSKINRHYFSYEIKIKKMFYK